MGWSLSHELLAYLILLLNSHSAKSQFLLVIALVVSSLASSDFE